MALSKSTGFTEHIRILNGLSDFSTWRFYPGMRFEETAKWWDDRTLRPRPHEGVDLLYYQTISGEEKRLDPHVRIPAAREGTVIHVGDDFLGSSIYVDLKIPDNSERTLHTIYAHVIPEPGIGPGCAIREGQVIATISDLRLGTSPVMPHLHVSMAWIPKGIDATDLDWKKLVELPRIKFCDPLTHFCGRHITAGEPGEGGA